MTENGIRGGVSTISHHYAKANNPYLVDTYDKDEPTNYIIYLDANNLYGWAMSQYLPTGGFKWISGIDFNVIELDDDARKGCILEVDLDYPSELHDLHNDYPLAPENLEIDKVNKLVPNLQDKRKYVIHYRALKQCLRQGQKTKHLYDTSNYSEEHPIYSVVNKKVLGKMKDETEGRPIEEFVGLRAKLYSYKVAGVEEKKAKGVSGAECNQATYTVG
jgi:hypothetical protein